jgi:hypothetical protein
MHMQAGKSLLRDTTKKPARQSWFWIDTIQLTMPDMAVLWVV